MTKLITTTLTLSLALLCSTAHAGDPKPAAPMPPAKDAAKGPEMPKAPQEVADMAKGMVGTWKCKGKGTIAGTTMDVKATITHKLDLDKWWIQSSLVGTVGKANYKFTQLTTYDATAKKWHRLLADNLGTAETLESSGMTDGKVVWEGTGTRMGMTMKVRDTEELSKDGKSLHTIGEASPDGGKTWNQGHDATCTK